MSRRIALSLALLSVLASACGTGGLRSPTFTPTPTETLTPRPSPTSTPTSTHTNTSTATATATLTQTATATAAICPKGTILHPSVNRCFYATRTPKPEHSYCEDIGKAADCRASGCTWIRKTRTCSP
jgi:hypothetical protein